MGKMWRGSFSYGEVFKNVVEYVCVGRGGCDGGGKDILWIKKTLLVENHAGVHIFINFVGVVWKMKNVVQGSRNRKIPSTFSTVIEEYVAYNMCLYIIIHQLIWWQPTGGIHGQCWLGEPTGGIHGQCWLDTE